MNYQPFDIFLKNTSVLIAAINFLVVNGKNLSYFEKFNGSLFLMIEEFDGSFLIRAFLIERECVYRSGHTFVLTHGVTKTVTSGSLGFKLSYKQLPCNAANSQYNGET